MSDPSRVNIAIAEAFGIDPTEAIGFTVKVRRDDYPLVTVTRRLKDPMDPGVAEEVRSAFRLVPAEDALGDEEANPA